MNPQFNAYGLLEPGIVELDERTMVDVLGFTSSRRELIEKGLKPFLRELNSFRVERIYIDGSFVTDKPVPDDIDGIAPVLFGDPLHLFLTQEWERLKKTYRIDFYPAHTDRDDPGSMDYWMDFFGATRDEPPRAKGIVALLLGSEERHV